MISIPHLPRVLAVAVAAALALVAGCGASASDRSPVHGSVFYDGQPVDAGGIAFLPDGEAEGPERLRATGLIREGRYDLDARHGPTPGKYRVQIFWNKKTGRQVPGEGKRLKDETQQVIPPQYNTASELTVEVKPGRNTFDFNLKK